MASLGVALYEQLKNDATVGPLVLHSGAYAIYPIALAQNPTWPAVSYQVISETQLHTVDNTHAPNAVLQIDCWSKTYLQASQLADAISSVLNGFRGLLGGTVSVNTMLQRNRQELLASAEDIGTFRVMLEFSVWYN